MATTTTNVEQVKLNVMTQAQYDAATKSATELYMITDAKIDGLPDQTGQSGKYLTTDGTTASWAATITTVEAGTTANKINVIKGGSTSTITINNVANATTASKLGNTTVGGVNQPIYLDSGTPTALSYTIEKSVPSNALFTDHTYTNGAGINLSNDTFSAKCDTTTVSTNGSNQLQAIGVIDKKASGAVYTWKGTKGDYDALSTYHNDWIYYITGDSILPSDTYYTKTQIDAMLANNQTVVHDTAKIILKDTNSAADVSNPTANHNGGLVQFQDKNGATSGYLYTAYKSTGEVEQVLESDRLVDGSVVSANIKVGIDSNGNAYTTAPTPAATASILDENIATVGWINDPNKATGIVHITGSETILGAKTFSNNNIFTGTDTFTGNTQFIGNPVFVGNASTDPFTLKNSAEVYSQAPAQTLSTNISFRDNNNDITGGLEHYHQADGTTITRLTTRQQGDINYGIISVSIDSEGNTRCDLPTDTYATNFHGVSTRSLWADLAENYKSDKQYSIGTLIKFGGIKDITIADNEVNGVISDKPGYLLDADLKDALPVALVGKTPIRIIGKVKKFDKIVLSEVSGVGRVLKDGENLPVIARALETVDNTSEKLVLCVTKFNLG